MSQRNTTNVVKSRLSELGGAEQFPMNEQEIALRDKRVGMAVGLVGLIVGGGLAMVGLVKVITWALG